MRFIDAEKLEEQYKKLISDAETERAKYNPEEDRRSWEIWTVILADHYAYLAALITAEKIECKPKHPYWVKQLGEPITFKCSNCGYKTLITADYCPQCKRFIMGGNHVT